MAKTNPRRKREPEKTPEASGREGPGPVWRIAKRLALPAIVFCWPLLYFFRHLLVINHSYMAIGNDYIMLYYKYKVYLLDCLANFHLPLWSPSEAAGFPFYTSPFTQTFYPFNALLVLFYKAFNGYSALDHQYFTVLGISIFALGLYFWLKLINRDTRAVIFAVLVMSVSYKITETIRFPNAVHSAAWYPWILYALTRIMFSDSVKETVKSAGLLVLFGIFLCTAGYPYFAYYSIFLVCPYLLAFLITPLRTKLFAGKTVNFKRAFIGLSAGGFAAALLCAPYVVGVKRLMSETIDRAGKSFEYSTSHIFNYEDTLGSLVYPPAASTEGWYFFSITALLIIALYLFGRRKPIVGGESQEIMPVDTGSLWVKLFFVLWFAMITYITYAKSSYLFIFLWKFLPGFSSLRNWGRLDIVLVPILAWLLSIAYSHFSRTISGSKEDGAPRPLSTELGILVAVYTAVLSVQLFMHIEGFRDPLWQQYFKAVEANEVLFILFGAAAFVAILLIIAIGAKIRFGRSGLAAVTVLLVMVATVELWHTGSRMWSVRISKIPVRDRLDIDKMTKLSFNYPRVDAINTITLAPVFNVGIVENWYFDRYVSFLKRTENQAGARGVLLGIRDGQKMFFSESIEHPTIDSFLRDALRYGQPRGLIAYNGDELKWEIDAPSTGYLSFIDNWDPDWKAFVDEKPVPIELLFGTFKSVRLTQGRHIVIFKYQPGLFPAPYVKTEKTAPDPFLEKNGS
jgi:hypothetical protein